MSEPIQHRLYLDIKPSKGTSHQYLVEIEMWDFGRPITVRLTRLDAKQETAYLCMSHNSESIENRSTVTHDGLECTCPDFVHHWAGTPGRCKHLASLEALGILQPR